MKYLTLVYLLLASINAYAVDCGNDSGRPYQFDAVYTADMLDNVAGGLRRQSAYLDNLDLTLSVNGQRALGWSNTCLFAYGLYNNGAHFTDGIVGDAQYVSNIETDVRAARLYEAWVEHFFRLWSTEAQPASVKFGLYDLNSEFDVVNTAGLFINSAHGIDSTFGLSGTNGPSIFPVTSLAIRGEMAVTRHWRVRAALLDAVPGDPQHPGRTAIRFGNGTLGVIETVASSGMHREGFGYWHYSEKFQPLAGGVPARGNAGWYAFAESALPGAPAVSVFARLGHASPVFNEFGTYVGAGIVYRGAITGSNKDALGFAVAWAQTGEPYQFVTGSLDKEVNLELTWHLQLSDAVSIQPDMQYVIHPGANPALGNALVVGVRGVINFNPG